MEVPKEKDQTPGFLRFHLKNPGLFVGMDLTSTEVIETELLRLEPSPYNLGRWPVCVCASKSLIGAAEEVK